MAKYSETRWDTRDVSLSLSSSSVSLSVSQIVSLHTAPHLRNKQNTHISNNDTNIMTLVPWLSKFLRGKIYILQFVEISTTVHLTHKHAHTIFFWYWDSESYWDSDETPILILAQQYALIIKSGIVWYEVKEVQWFIINDLLTGQKPGFSSSKTVLCVNYDEEKQQQIPTVQETHENKHLQMWN